MGALHLIQDLLRPLTKGGDFFNTRQVLFVYRAHVERKPFLSRWFCQLAKPPNALELIVPDLIKRPLHRVQSLFPFLGLLNGQSGHQMTCK